MRAVLITAILLWPVSAFSGPDETINHLINDSASMLDIGMLRLNNLLQDNKLGEATYSWEENRIRIEVYRQDKVNSDVAEVECAQWVKAVRSAAAVNLKTGEAIFDYTFFSAPFRHAGFKRADDMADLTKKIDRLIVLRCNYWGANPAVTVDAALLGTGYSLAK